MKNTQSIKIPFSGFHESEASVYTQDHPEYEELFCFEYVTQFEGYFNKSCGLDISLKFHELIRPEFYDENTDEIVCHISHKDIRSIYDATNQAILADFIDHSDLDGFSRSLDNWGSHMLYELILACLATHDALELDYFSLFDSMPMDFIEQDGNTRSEAQRS